MDAWKKGAGDRLAEMLTPNSRAVRFFSLSLLVVCAILPITLILLVPEKTLVMGKTFLYSLSLLTLLSAAGVFFFLEYGRVLSLVLLATTMLLYLIQCFDTLTALPHLVGAGFTFWYLRRYEVMQHFISPAFSMKRTPFRIRAEDLLKRAGSHLILFIAVLVATFPIIWIISTSLKPGNQLIDTEIQIWPDTFTLDHYRHVIFEEHFEKYLINSLICAGGTTLLTIFLATTGAYALSKFDFKGKKGVLFSFIVVQMFPGVIIIVPYFMLLKNLGLLNSYLGLILAYSVTALPLCVWTIKGFFDTIPDDLIEAARVDGYSHSKIFWKIMLPLAKPGLAVTALFAFLSAWNEYVLAYTFMMTEDNYTLPVKIYMYIGGSSVQWGTFAAMSVLVSIPVVILFIAFQSFLTSGMTKGAVKG